MKLLQVANPRAGHGRAGRLLTEVGDICRDLGLEVDGEAIEREATFLEISNSRFTADFLMAPEARIDDGLLDITLLGKISRRRLLRHLWCGRLARTIPLQSKKCGRDGRTTMATCWDSDHPAFVCSLILASIAANSSRRWFWKMVKDSSARRRSVTRSEKARCRTSSRASRCSIN